MIGDTPTDLLMLAERAQRAEKVLQLIEKLAMAPRGQKARYIHEAEKIALAPARQRTKQRHGAST